MSERKLKLHNRPEYKRKSKHTRNPSYYPRHLTKVSAADFDEEYELSVTKEQSAIRGIALSVRSKRGRTSYNSNWAWVRESRMEKFIFKFVGKPYKELCIAWHKWLAPVKNTDFGVITKLENYFTIPKYTRREYVFSVDDADLVRATPYVRPTRQPCMSKAYSKENAKHKIPDFGRISVPFKDSFRSTFDGSSLKETGSNGIDKDYYKARPLGDYWCIVNGVTVKLPVYHVPGGSRYARHCITDPEKSYSSKFRVGTPEYLYAEKLEQQWVFLKIHCTPTGYIDSMLQHFRHDVVRTMENPQYDRNIEDRDLLQKQYDEALLNPEFPEEGLERLRKKLVWAIADVENTPKVIKVNVGYGQLTPLIKRQDYERVIETMASEVSL